jgi:AcrR family transcriptional regulator
VSPRPRTASDDDILDGVGRAVSRLGPEGLTLAGVGAECGLSAAAVAQRFGSRGALLRGYAERREAGMRAALEAARTAGGSPLLALVDALARVTAAAPDGGALANHLALQHAELAEVETHQRRVAGAWAVREETAALLEAAVRAGELVPCDTAGLARTVQTTLHGALATWAVFREGSADDWLRDELEAVLAPYLTR